MSTPLSPDNLQHVLEAMDAIDELRHADRLVDQALSSDSERQRMLERLRTLYAEQGISVSDELINQALDMLQQDQLRYQRKGSQWQRRLAGLYIARSRWLKPAAVGLLVVGALSWFGDAADNVGVNAFGKPLAVTLRTEYVEALSRVDGSGEMELMNRVDAINFSGTSALAQGDNNAVQAAIAELKAFNESNGEAYDLRLVRESGQPALITRPGLTPDLPPRHFLLVEALNARNFPVAVEVFSEDTGQRERVMRYGQQIPTELALHFQREFTQHGKYPLTTIARKHRGRFQPEYDIEVLVGVITQW